MRGYADQREKIHADHATSRPLSADYEMVGLAGELALSQLTGLAPDLSLKPGGDGGRDSWVYIRYSVDVKTARKAYNLIHEAGKPFADIFVLAQYSDDTGLAELIGWEWGRVLAAAPTRDFGHGVINHFIPRANLKPVSELADRAWRAK